MSRKRYPEAVSLASLRASAEAQLAGEPATAPAADGDKLVHELQVHQIELEMQNEALRQAQEALEESRDRYVDLYDFAPVAYLTLGESGLIAQVNLTGAALLGEERQRLVGRRFAHFVAAEDGDLWHHFFLRALLHRGPHGCELAMQRRDGSRLDVRVDSMSSITAGETPRLRMALADISERKRTEAELRIAAVAFESQEGMIVTDPRGVIVRVNRAFTRLTGYGAEEAIGRTPALLSSGHHDPAFYQRMWQELGNAGYWQGEIWNRRKDGKIYVEWLTISAVRSAAGELSHYVGTFSEITQNRETEAEIHRLAYYDPLTSLPNRRLLHDRIGLVLAASRRTGRCGALLFLDLDNFKNLNDTRGHDVGDRLLIQTALRIQANVRASDTVARLGGDEFVVMVDDLSGDTAAAAVQAGLVGEKLREALGQPIDIDGGEFHCSASIGIAIFHDHGESAEALLKHADLAMYQAKNAGRNALRFFDPAMQVALEERSALERDLRQALKLGQLHLYYQAQVAADHRIVGAEALLRWPHPQRGMVSPADFIPLAEETGLILPIGHWVLETACRQLKAWAAHPATADLCLAVNVSARQFRQPDFVAQVAALLAQSGAAPSRLKIELTESMVLDDVADTFDKMHALKAMGIGLALDDFGTGSSSLSYLSRLPLDQLKIDRSFVLNLPDAANDAVIVQTIITMATSLGLDVIAEGVETEAQRAFLERHDCHAYQGFLFSRPLALAEFQRLLL